MAHPQHAVVRQRFGFRCGYCGTSESQSGGELTVDHFQPLSVGGSDALVNLVYACFRCNLFKADFWPSAGDPVERRVLHPENDMLSDHLELDRESGLLMPRSETGRFHLNLLHLNRDALVERRREASRQEQQEQYVELLEEIIVRQRSLLNLYERLLGGNS